MQQKKLVASEKCSMLERKDSCFRSAVFLYLGLAQAEPRRKLRNLCLGICVLGTCANQNRKAIKQVPLEQRLHGIRDLNPELPDTRTAGNRPTR